MNLNNLKQRLIAKKHRQLNSVIPDERRQPKKMIKSETVVKFGDNQTTMHVDKFKQRLRRKMFHNSFGLYDKFPEFMNSEKLRPFAGDAIVTLIHNDHKMIRWCVDNIIWFHLDAEAELNLEEAESEA